MRKSTQIIAMEVIEGLTILYQDGKRSLKNAENILDEIYRYSHLANEHCENPHCNWEAELNKMHKALKENYI